MPAQFFAVGEPAHDAERQALRHLVEGLSAEYTVYGNAWLVEPNGSVFEVDAVVAAPHGIFVVEIKAFRQPVHGNDHDWYVPYTIRSPLKLNRKTAQVLASSLNRKSVDAARPFVEGFVYLSHTTEVRITSPASAGRIHTRKTILDALVDKASFQRRNPVSPPLDEHGRRILHELLTGADPRRRPVRSIREWKLLATVEQSDRYVEHLAEHELTRARSVLRVYSIDGLASDAERKRIEDRFRWEAQVLRRIGDHPSVLHAEAPFIDPAGLVLPFENFEGVSLLSWLADHNKKLHGNAGVEQRVALWRNIVDALAHAHRQGVIHRLLRPEVILVQNVTTAPEVRVTGFELAKQVYLGGATVAVSSLHDERKRWAAPEVVRSFTDADPRADQFGLGALLGLILTGRPLFDSTEDLVRRNGLVTRVRDLNPYVKESLDNVVHTMLAISSASRFSSLDEALVAVAAALTGRAVTTDLFSPPALDPENLAAGQRIGPDYEILSKLGAGGFGTVYAARHLVTGTTRALKVARMDPAAVEALERESKALERLDHPNIVRARDISNVIPERKTLIMERVKGEPLSQWLKKPGATDDVRRLYAEHLLSALAYLEQREVTHKDIKPDNLIVSDDGLTLIDFSLAGEGLDATLVGTSLYRDPALERWSHVADRYAAALCLFELYAGRHPFDGQAPAPDEAPHVDEQEFDRPELVAFFRKALNPLPGVRFPSSSALRAGLLEALGAQSTEAQTDFRGIAAPDGGQTPLSATSLHSTPLAVLRRANIRTQSDLVNLTEAQIGNLSGLGNKRRAEVLALRGSLLAHGVKPTVSVATERRPLWPPLLGEEADLHRLGLPATVANALSKAGFSTVGRLADATRDDLTGLTGIGPKTVAQIVEHLQRFADNLAGMGPPATLARIWELASAPLKGNQEEVIARSLGIRGVRAMQSEIAADLYKSGPHVSQSYTQGLDVLDRRILDSVVDHCEDLLDRAGGLLRLDEAARRLEERWPAGETIHAAGILRLAAKLAAARFTCIDDLEDECGEVLARPFIDRKALRTFVESARTLAKWPPKSAEAARHSLRAYLPEFGNDPLSLVERLLTDVRLTEDGELFEAPVTLEQAIRHILHPARLPISVAELRARIQGMFGAGAPAEAHPGDLEEVLQRLQQKHLDFHFDAERGEIRQPGMRSIETPVVAGDALPLELAVHDPAARVGQILREVSTSRGYRLLVTPPETHAEIGRSVARALGPGALFVSFEETFLRRIDGRIDEFDRAERFKAQKPRLTREAEALVDELLEEHGQPGKVVVLGDTALLGVCEALHLVRRLYDQTLSGARGFWALVIPGVVCERQPLFNERPGAAVFHIEGSILPLQREIPAA